MKMDHLSTVIFCLAFAVSVKSVADDAYTNNYRSNHVCVFSPWAYDSLGKQVGAAFMSISAQAGMQDRLIGADAPIADRTEIHNIEMQDGVMMMQAVSDLEFSSKEPLILRPHGLHIMLMGLHEPLKAGTPIDLTLDFERAGKVNMQVSVLALGSQLWEQKTECE